MRNILIRRAARGWVVLLDWFELFPSSNRDLAFTPLSHCGDFVRSVQPNSTQNTLTATTCVHWHYSIEEEDVMMAPTLLLFFVHLWIPGLYSVVLQNNKTKQNNKDLWTWTWTRCQTDWMKWNKRESLVIGLLHTVASFVGSVVLYVMLSLYACLHVWCETSITDMIPSWPQPVGRASAGGVELPDLCSSSSSSCCRLAPPRCISRY